MFLARKVRSVEEEQIADQILEQYDIEDEVNYQSAKYVIEVEEKVVGVSKVDFHENIGILKYMTIDKDEVGDDLGDALLRAVLNYSVNNGIDKVYYPEKDSYLIKFGFSEKENTTTIDGEKRKFELELELEPFFSSPCKGSQ